MAGNVFDVDEALVVVDGNALGFGVFDDGAMECGAGDHDGGLAIACWISAGHAGEELAVLVLEGPFVGGDADVTDLLG